MLAGRYRIASRLGRGGMSAVYLARHVVIDRLVAVKVLRRDLAADPAQRTRFLREAQAANRIQHENIVDVTDYGETSDGVLYLVMEYLPGESLLGAVCSGTLPVLRALDIARQIAAGIGHAHEMRVVHRDLKPDNVILVPRPRGRELVKLLDFGVAKVLDEPSLTLNRRVFGTPGYIAPEYAAGLELSTRSDLYALGVLLYEMVTGALPHDASHPGEMLLRTATEPPIPPSVRVPTLPARVERIILRCLQKSPDARHRDAFHFIDEVDDALRALRDDPRRRRGSPPAGRPAQRAPRARRARRRRAHPRARGAATKTPPDAPGPRGSPARGAPPRRRRGSPWGAAVDALRARVAQQFWGEDIARELDALDLAAREALGRRGGRGAGQRAAARGRGAHPGDAPRLGPREGCAGRRALEDAPEPRSSCAPAARRPRRDARRARARSSRCGSSPRVSSSSPSSPTRTRRITAAARRRSTRRSTR